MQYVARSVPSRSFHRVMCRQEIANFWQKITLRKSAANSTLCMIKTLKYKNDHIYHQKQSIFENKFLKTSTAVHV